MAQPLWKAAWLVLNKLRTVTHQFRSGCTPKEVESQRDTPKEHWSLEPKRWTPPQCLKMDGCRSRMSQAHTMEKDIPTPATHERALSVLRQIK
jgi:hypothetical protein